MNRLFLLLVCTSLIACKKKDEKPLNEVFDTNGATLISQANFSNNAHTTTGCVRVYSKNSEKYLVFEGFKTDKGPDLRVYISKETNANNFIEVGNLKSIIGSFYYTINNSINTNDYKYVLIWCEDFSVLFGNALLQ